MDKDQSGDEDDDCDNDERNAHTSSNKFDCPFCFEVRNSAESLRYHKRVHHVKKRYTCKICETVLVSHYGWQYHTRKHNNDFRYSCDSCEMKFCTFQQFVTHTDNHNYFCSVCDKGFVYLRQLRKHEIEEHSLEDFTKDDLNLLKKFRCEKCGITFASSIGWRKHLKNNERCRPYVCEQCGSGFLSEIHYESHVSFYRNCHKVMEKRERQKMKNNISPVRLSVPRIHSTNAAPVDERITNPYYCNKCDGTFAKVQLRREHWIRNLDCRPYGCNNCNAKFVTKEDIEKHVRIHMFKCQFCSRNFSFKNNFDLHICRSRNGNRSLLDSTSVLKSVEKIFQCQYCEETYYTEEDLQNHIEFVSKFLYICSKCFETFHNECTFGYHLANSHGSINNVK